MNLQQARSELLEYLASSRQSRDLIYCTVILLTMLPFSAKSRFGDDYVLEELYIGASTRIPMTHLVGRFFKWHVIAMGPVKMTWCTIPTTLDLSSEVSRTLLKKYMCCTCLFCAPTHPGPRIASYSSTMLTNYTALINQQLLERQFTVAAMKTSSLQSFKFMTHVDQSIDTLVEYSK